MKKKRILWLLAFIGLFQSACVNDWKQFLTEDIDKITLDSIHVTPAAAVHVGSATFKIGDLINEKPDTFIFDANNDSLMKFIMNIDTLYKMAVSDVYQMPALDPISGIKMDMGDMTMAPLNVSQDVLLKTMINTINPSLYPQEGVPVPFPEINGLPAGDFSYQGFDSFKSATFKSGQFTVTMTNNTPLTVTAILALRNADGTYFGTDVTFSNVAPGQTSSQVVDAAGQTMIPTVIGEVKSFSTPGAPVTNPITLDGTEALKFEVKTTGDLIIQSANAKVPYTEFTSDTSISITPADNPTMDIKTLKLKSGGVNFAVNGSFPAPITLEISMPYTKDASGNPLTQTLQIGGTNTSATLDLSNTTTDLTQGGTTKNAFSIQYKGYTSDTSNYYTFTPPASFTLDATFDNFAFDYIEGSLGNLDSIAIPSDTMNLGIGDLFSKLNGSIKITDPKITLGVQNSFGFGVDLNINLTGTNKNNTVDLNIAQSILGASTPGDDQFSSLVIDKNTDNGKLIDLIALPPENLTFGGYAKLTGKKASNLFITEASRVLTSLDINIPLVLNLNNVSFTDTMKLDSASVPKEIKEAVLVLNTTNGFPLGIGLEIEMYDSIANQTIETITAKDINGQEVLLPSAKVEADGSITPGTTKVILDLTKEDFENLQKANQLILHLYLSTDDAASGKGVPFRANSKITIDVAVAAQADVTVKP